jgi:hypothetical protein
MQVANRGDRVENTRHVTTISSLRPHPSSTRLMVANRGINLQRGVVRFGN